MGVRIPATGTGDTTPLVATDKIASVDYQQVKIVDGTVGGTQGAVIDASGNLAVALKAATALLGASVSNFPSTQPVNIASYSVTQPISIASTSVTQPVSGNVTASVIGEVGASVTNFPANQNVTVTGQPISVNIASYNGGAPLIGASIGNLPVGQSVLGYVGASVTNFPATQSVQGLVGASVSNLPATQPVSGNVTASVVGYIGASITNGLTLSGLVGASISNVPSMFVAGGSITLASSTIQVGVSVANYPTNIGSATTFIASALPGLLIGASVSNQSAAGAASQVVVGGSITIASMTPGLYLGASVPNFPATQSIQGLVGASISNTPQINIASYSVTQPVSVASTNVTQPVSGNVTASVIGYVGASVAAGASVNAFNVGGSTISVPAAAPVAGLGASPYSYITGASFNNLNVKNAAGTLYDVAAMNTNTSPRFLRLFDKATTPSPGVDQHPVRVLTIPGASAGAGVVNAMPVGLLFAAGIGFCVTGGSVGASDTTATLLGDVVVNLAYS